MFSTEREEAGVVFVISSARRGKADDSTAAVPGQVSGLGRELSAGSALARGQCRGEGEPGSGLGAREGEQAGIMSCLNEELGFVQNFGFE